MRSVLHTLLFVLSMSGLIFAVSSLTSVSRAIDAHQLVQDAAVREQSFVPDSLKKLVDSVDTKSPVAGKVFYDLGRLYQQIAERQRADGSQEWYCRALHSFGKALVSSPRNGSYLAAWANVKQLLGAAGCEDADFTQGDYRSVLEYALKEAPVDADIFFSAGLLHYWDGDKAKALKYFHGFLRFTTEVRPIHEEYIVSAVTSAEELQEVIPARFPHVVNWAAIFQERKSRQFDKYRSAFASLQSKALDQVTDAFQREEIPGLVYKNHLSALFAFVATDAVRSKLDALYADFLNSFRNPAHADFYRNRSTLKELARVVSWQGADRRPKNSQLALWGRNEMITFDRRGTSIGFFLPAGQNLKRLELHGLKDDGRVDAQQVRLYASNNNVDWIELKSEGLVQTLMIEKYPVVLIQPGEGDYRYWKVHHAGPGQERFSNFLHRLIRLYGDSVRRES